MNPERELEIDLIVKRCPAVCPLGKMVHELYSAYLTEKRERENEDNIRWERIKKREAKQKKN